jgi:epoxyqueuosine reductase
MNDVEQQRRGPASREDMTAHVKARALELGFSAVGVTSLGANPHAAELDAWLRAGHGATMTYLNRQAEKRKDPRQIMPEGRCAVVTLTNYYHGCDDPAAMPRGLAPANPGTKPRGSREAARIAQYAWSTDYHAVIEPRLEHLADAIRVAAPGARTRCYVDAGPVPERELAQLAGLGWIGKNMMLIHPRIGSFTFIGVVLTDAPLAVDPPFTTDHCGTCRRCLDACPTAAFVAPGVLDARRCISYLTIEHRGSFDATQSAMLGEWLFGCDVCQDVCPWNEKFAVPTADAALGGRDDLRAPDVAALGADDGAEFDRRFGDTALARAGAAGMRRNVAALRERA